MSRIYLGIGSNLGDKEQNIMTALKLVKERVGTIVIQSSICKTMPWGFHSDNIFYNAAACVETNLTPMQVLSVIKMIEMEMASERSSFLALAAAPVAIAAEVPQTEVAEARVITSGLLPIFKTLVPNHHMKRMTIGVTIQAMPRP